MSHSRERLNNDSETSHENKQIFIVDDDQSVCCALGIMLITYGFKVDIFTSANDFFRAVPDDSVPGCLILDIHMPGMDGWEMLKQITGSGSTRRVIVISADKDSVNQKRAIEAGAAGYLQKPFDGSELVGFIKDALKR